MKRILRLLLLSICLPLFSQAQDTLSKDELIGGFLPERTLWNLLHYDFTITIDPPTKHLNGYNQITFELLAPLKRMQVDLHETMQVDSIIYENKKLSFERLHWSLFIDLPAIALHKREQITVYYQGHPIVAVNAPWDGGYTTQLDKNGKYHIGMAVQGTGSSVWLPSKDGQSDEPDEGVIANIIVPADLAAISNGRLIKKEEINRTHTKWTWQVKNPINSYCITFNIGDYVNINRRYKNLELSYWVLRSNQKIAESHFAVVPEMIGIFEKYFGPYPFPEDGYKIVETSFAGMEHQSNIAYGNYFKNGYAGNGNRIARRFDFILIHESAHEWFGNSITSKDIADMWIHEAFTTYAEFLFVEEKWGKQAVNEYLQQVIPSITNQNPIIGNYACNHKGDTDMYYKGAMMIHTLRNHINDDSLFFKTLKGFATQFQKQIIEAEDVFQYFSTQLNQDLRPFFLTYLTQTQLPELIITKDKEVYFQHVQPGFQLQLDLFVKNKKQKWLITDIPQKIKGIYLPKPKDMFTPKAAEKEPSIFNYLIESVYHY